MIKGVSSTLIWLWNDDQRDFLYFDLGLLFAKSQNLELDFNWWLLHCPNISDMCDFHLLILDFNFIKKSLIDKRFFFWETFDFWYFAKFEIFISNSKTLEPRNF